MFLFRHARPCAGHPRLACCAKDVGGRDEPGHDSERGKSGHDADGDKTQQRRPAMKPHVAWLMAAILVTLLGDQAFAQSQQSVPATRYGTALGLPRDGAKLYL